jgi:hypothetical protein
MSERQAGPYDSIARKLLALAERRQAHFVELVDSGRWRHYFSRDDLDREMRKAAALRDQWARIAGIVADDDFSDELGRTTAP